MKDQTHGVYTFNADPCIIDFNFEDREVTVKEQGSCGNHRGIKCFFDDQYTRKRKLEITKRNNNTIHSITPNSPFKSF